MADFIKNLASDLLRLEVNTIIKQNMTAEKIPANKRVLLRRLAQNYRDAMADYGVAKLPEENIRPEDSGRVFRWRFGGEYAFQEISNIAKAALEGIEDTLKHATNEAERQALIAKQKILLRIRSQSSNVIGIFKLLRREMAPETLTRPDDWWENEDAFLDTEHFLYAQYKAGALPKGCVPFRSHRETLKWNNDLDWSDLNTAPELPLTPDVLSMLYKAYEIGTEQIVLQTVIQIEGDVTSYITPTYLALPDQAKEIVMGIHNRSIGTSTQFWSALFTTVVNLAGRTFNQIFGRA
jgi:hypothetical protein